MKRLGGIYRNDKIKKSAKKSELFLQKTALPQLITWERRLIATAGRTGLFSF